MTPEEIEDLKTNISTRVEAEQKDGYSICMVPMSFFACSCCQKQIDGPVKGGLAVIRHEETKTSYCAPLILCMACVDKEHDETMRSDILTRGLAGETL